MTNIKSVKSSKRRTKYKGNESRAVVMTEPPSLGFKCPSSGRGEKSLSPRALRHSLIVVMCIRLHHSDPRPTTAAAAAWCHPDPLASSLTFACLPLPSLSFCLFTFTPLKDSHPLPQCRQQKEVTSFFLNHAKIQDCQEKCTITLRARHLAHVHFMTSASASPTLREIHSK